MSYIQNFAVEFDLFYSESEALIQQVVEQIGNRAEDLTDFVFDQIDELKGYVAAGAANDCTDDEFEQEEAISMAENWVSDSFGANNLQDDLAVIFWLHGKDDGLKLVYHELGMDL